MTRIIGLLVAIGLLIGPALVVPGDAFANQVAVVTVSAVDKGPTAGCEIWVTATWTEDLPGPTVTATLYRSDNGGQFEAVGSHIRIENNNSDVFRDARELVVGETYDYRVEITKGPKHVIAAGNLPEGVMCVTEG